MPLRTIILGAAALAAAGLLVALLLPRTDYRAQFDHQVEETWVSGRDVAPALEFFSGGGVYQSDDAGRTIDQKVFVPLIERLQKEHHLEFEVVVEESQPQFACALIALAPEDRDSRNAIRSAILEAAEKSPGFLYQHWGHNWLTLDYFDEQELKPMERTGVLRKLRASQRRMD